MSVEAITWALGQRVGRSTAKFVLTILANCADGKEFLCFPSVAYISEATDQDRKTVIAAIAKLVEMGFVEDSGERRGTTGQIIVYRLLVGKNGTVKESQKRNGSKNGTVPKSTGKSPKNGVKESQKRTETVPKTGHGNVIKQKETKENRQDGSQSTPSVDNSTPKASAQGARLPADWVLPKSLGVWAAAEQPTWTPEHIRKVAAAFKDHWIAQPGIKGRKTDWAATWRNWVRKEPALGGARSAHVGAVASGSWWEGDAGINAKGTELGVARHKDEPTPMYLLRIAKVAGRGPWIDHILRHAKTSGERWFNQVVATLGDGLLPADF